MMVFLYLALGLAVVGILSLAVPKLFKSETNKKRASPDVTEIAAFIANRLARNRDGSAESGDSQQADAFVLNDAGCTFDGAAFRRRGRAKASLLSNVARPATRHEANVRRISTKSRRMP